MKSKNKIHSRTLFTKAMLASALSVGSLVCAQRTLAADLSDITLEQLMNIKVMSVSKKLESLRQAAAAIFVITQDDIRRSGATSIAEVLRLAPGLDVTRVNSNTWAISSRGFNLVFADKLLVLIDGRSVYTPLFSGVYWDVQDAPLEDIERIEVIRGPGATLWGANAVNGVINIITKNSKDTQGGLVSAGGGSEERGFGHARYGGKIDENTTYRAYGKYANHDNSVNETGARKNDDWDMGRGGFRVDSAVNDTDSVSVSGDGYYGEEGATTSLPSFNPPFLNNAEDDTYVSGADVLGRWTRSFDKDSELQVQSYYDIAQRNQLIFEQTIQTFDVDVQHRLVPTEGHEVVWGLEYRLVHDALVGSEFVEFDPSDRNTHLYAAFAQDEIQIIPDRLKFTLGSKFEHNSFTGFEYQPSGRALLTLNERNAIWGAVSRAVRTPNRASDDVRTLLAVCPGGISPDCPGTPGVPTAIFVQGSRDYRSEELLAYELGYRSQLSDTFSVDVAGFFNSYDELNNTGPGTPNFATSPQPHLEVPLVFSNENSAETHGVEAVFDWRALESWRLTGYYTYLKIHYVEGGLAAVPGSDQAVQSPQHQVSVRSAIDLPYNLEFDSTFRYVSDLPIEDRNVPDYVNLDLRLAWLVDKDLELSVVGQNLIEDHHREFVSAFIDRTIGEVQRGVYGKVTWRF